MVSAQQTVFTVCNLLPYLPVSDTLTLTLECGRSRRRVKGAEESTSRNRGNAVCRKDKKQRGGLAERLACTREEEKHHSTGSN